MLLGTKGTGKEVHKAGQIILPHPGTNFEIQKHYQNEHKFNIIYTLNK